MISKGVEGFFGITPAQSGQFLLREKGDEERNIVPNIAVCSRSALNSRNCLITGQAEHSGFVIDQRQYFLSV